MNDQRKIAHQGQADVCLLAGRHLALCARRRFKLDQSADSPALPEKVTFSVLFIGGQRESYVSALAPWPANVAAISRSLYRRCLEFPRPAVAMNASQGSVQDLDNM